MDPETDAACIKRSPDITRASLFANNIFLPLFAAAIVEFNPAAPTIAAITVLALESAATSTSAEGPILSSVSQSDSLKSV